MTWSRLISALFALNLFNDPDLSLAAAYGDGRARSEDLVHQQTYARDSPAPSRNVSACPGYNLQDLSENDNGIRAQLKLAGAPCNAFGQDIEDLTVEVTYESPTRLHVNIYDTAKNQFTVPTSIVDPPGGVSSKSNSDLVFNYTTTPFEFWITRRNANDEEKPLFDTRTKSLPQPPLPPVKAGDNSTTVDGFNLVFEDAYLQLSSALPNGANIYGLGEIVSSSGIRRDIENGTVQTNWARDVADPIDENAYGIHPFYLEHRPSTNGSGSTSHGVFLNSNAGADILLATIDEDTSLIQYRFLGGTLDLYIFAGPSNLEVVEQYAEVVGLPVWQPLWGFGFHLCRWGYLNVNETKDAVAKMKAAGIPLDVMWNDIDLYHAVRDFTTDPVSFPPDEVKAFIEELHANDQHYIPIVDAAIAKAVNSSDKYPPYDRGTEQDVFIKNPNGTEYVGQVWPGFTVFPDWFAENTSAWWKDNLQEWHNLGVEYDGIWLDMNEASSFCDGSCGSGTDISNTTAPFVLPGLPGSLVTAYPECYNAAEFGTSGNITVNGTLTCTATSSDITSSLLSKRGLGFAAMNDSSVNVTDPPYAIHNGYGPLSSKTLATDATHAGGYIELDTHNIWGTMEEKATHDALLDVLPGKRPFIISRSTFAGAGKWTNHWLGDNFSLWSYMHYMIQGVLQFQMFQIPMVGADTCGFNGNTDEELCNRWMQLAAWTPFYRNHNTKGAISQEPFVWDSVAEVSKAAIKERYRLAPYWYSLFANASRRGTPPLRPLFFEFPDETQLLGVDRQYLIGRDILVSPVLEPNTSTVTAFVPGAAQTVWRNWYTHEVVDASQGTPVTWDAPLGTLPVHVRGGSALLLFASPADTLVATARGGYELLVSLASDGSAYGAAYVDDGEQLPVGPSRELRFAVSQGQIAITGSGNYTIPGELEQITILGVPERPSAVAVGEEQVKFEYDDKVERVVVADIKVNLTSSEEIKVQWEA